MKATAFSFLSRRGSGESFTYLRVVESVAERVHRADDLVGMLSSEFVADELDQLLTDGYVVGRRSFGVRPGRAQELPVPRPAWEVLSKRPQDTIPVHHIDTTDGLLVVQSRVNVVRVEIIASGPERQAVAHGA